MILSTDGGETFELVLQPELVTEDSPNLHIHDVEYDPHAERIWVTVGDSGNTQIYWSDDLGDSWKAIGERGEAPHPTQVVAFKDCVVFGTDSTPEGIIRWERDGPDDEPDGVEDLVRPHVAIELEEPGRRRNTGVRAASLARPGGRRTRAVSHALWLLLDALRSAGVSRSRECRRKGVVRTLPDRRRGRLLTNVMGPLSMDGDRRTLVSDSNQCAPECGYQIDARVPKFWE